MLYNINMLYFWLFVLIAVLGVRFYYLKVYLTKKKMLEYKNLFEKAGYRVRLDPYQLYTSRMLDNYK